MSELQTLALGFLRDLRRDFERRMEAFSQSQASQTAAFKALEAKQTESEKLLRHLSEIYTRLTPLIDSINRTVNGGPL